MYKYEIGCHIDGNYMNADEFSLAIIKLAEDLGYQDAYDEKPEETDTDYSQVLHDMSCDCVDYINAETIETRPPFTYWTVEESQLFLCADVDDAQSEDSVIKSDDNNPAPSYILEVNDHGNATLYMIERKEVWTVV